jgi:putative SOS response-associated peptidase YedK
VWDTWRTEGHPTVPSCAIITVPANDLVRPFHDRMPAVVLPEDYDRWLDNATPTDELLGVLAPLPAEMMEAVRVGPAVNEVSNDTPDCITRRPDDDPAGPGDAPPRVVILPGGRGFGRPW